MLFAGPKAFLGWPSLAHGARGMKYHQPPQVASILLLPVWTGDGCCGEMSHRKFERKFQSRAMLKTINLQGHKQAGEDDSRLSSKSRTS